MEEPLPLFVLRGHDSVVHSVHFAGRGNERLLGADQEGAVRVWNLSNRRVETSFTPDGGAPVLAVHELCEGRWLTQSKEGLLSVWDAERVLSAGQRAGGDAGPPEGAARESVRVELHSFCKCEVMEEGLVALPDAEGIDVVLWDNRTPQLRDVVLKPSPVPGAGAQQQGVTTGPRGPHGMCMSLGRVGPRRLAGGYEDGSVQVWDWRGGGGGAEHTVRPHGEPVFGVGGAELPSRKHGECRGAIASGGADGNLAIGSWKEGEDGGATWGECEKFALKGDGLKGVSGVHVRPDGKIVAAACWDGRVRLYACKKPRPLASLACHSKAVQCVRFSRDSTLLASSSEDTRVAVWSVYPPEA